MFNKCIVLKNRAAYEMMWKNMVQPGRPQMIIQYAACAFYAGLVTLQTHTHNM